MAEPVLQKHTCVTVGTFYILHIGKKIAHNFLMISGGKVLVYLLNITTGKNLCIC